MRTTLNIRDKALKLCKQKAEETGKSLGDVVSDAILQVYSGKFSGRRRQYTLPFSGKGGLLPGVDLDDSAALQDIMDGPWCGSLLGCRRDKMIMNKSA